MPRQHQNTAGGSQNFAAPLSILLQGLRAGGSGLAPSPSSLQTCRLVRGSARDARGGTHASSSDPLPVWAAAIWKAGSKSVPALLGMEKPVCVSYRQQSANVGSPHPPEASTRCWSRGGHSSAGLCWLQVGVFFFFVSTSFTMKKQQKSPARFSSGIAPATSLEGCQERILLRDSAGSET